MLSSAMVRAPSAFAANLIFISLPPETGYPGHNMSGPVRTAGTGRGLRGRWWYWRIL